MRRVRRLIAAEGFALMDRRMVWAIAIALLGSAVGGLAMGALAVPFVDASAAERAGLVVSRGSAAWPALVALTAMTTASPYRDGSWLHRYLAAPSWPTRTATAAVPTLLFGCVLVVTAVVAAVSAAALVGVHPSIDTWIIAAAHLGVSLIWLTWMVCVAHWARSVVATLAVGIGLPFIVEPALAGVAAQSELSGLRWVLPSTALRALGEIPADGAAILEPVGDAALLVVGSVVVWTAVLFALAAIRSAGRAPR